jgi:hypothetical protein
LDGSLLALIPPGCDCGPTLKALATQAKTAHVGVYFVYNAESANFGLVKASAQTRTYGDGVARTVFDFGAVFFYAYMPYRLTALIVDPHGAALVVRAFPAGFDLTPDMKGLRPTH